MTHQIKDVTRRSLYIIRWNKPSVIIKEEINVRSEEEFSWNQTNFIPSQIYGSARDYKIPIILQANWFGKEFLADKVKILSKSKIETEINPNKSSLGSKINKIRHMEMLILAPPGSRSLFWIYKYPSCRRSAFCLSLGLPTKKGMKNDIISTELTLTICNTIR
ncbi:MAG: hypothetical protein AAGF07_00510 [Patescibacteria group bacterium]